MQVPAGATPPCIDIDMATPPGFAHLHVHTEHSPLDGLGHLDAACQKVAADGNTALAITDHGTMGGAWKFAKVARASGIKPIIGTEAYLAISSDWKVEPNRNDPQSVEVPNGDETATDMSEDEEGAVSKKTTKTKRNQHITLLARNAAGWANLVRISNAAAETFKGKPLMDFALIKEHSEGIIALTGCLGGPVLGPVSRGEFAEARKNLERIIDAVGHENVYVEVMEHGIDVESAALPAMAELAAEFGLPLVATNDAHYVNESDAETHAAWLTIQSGKTLNDPKRFQFHGSGFHLRTEAEMRALRPEPWWQDAVSNTGIVAARCEDVIPEPQMRLPKFGLPEGETDAGKYLVRLVREGAHKRYGSPVPENVQERLQTEFRIIKDMGFIDYFLIVWDVIKWSREKGIRVGPGRGSAAGSVISYCLGIVQVDPIANNLLFERFLEPGRTGMPDIDVDFEQGRRNEVLEYLAERWGRNRVARIGSFAAHKTRRALRDAGKLLESRPIGDALSKAVPVEGGKPYSFVRLLDTMDPAGAHFRVLLDEFGDAGQAVYKLASGFSDTVNGESIHACGTLISDEDMDGLVPLRRDRSKASSSGLSVVTQWDGTDVDEFGMLKLDVLGLRNLDVVSLAVRYIEETTGELLDPDDLPHPDVQDGWSDVDRVRVKRTWDLIGAGHTSGVFQMDSSGMQSLARQIEPDCLSDLSAIVALFRPGPLVAGMHTMYAERKAGIQDVDYSRLTTDPTEQAAIDSVLGETYGTFVYQEQLMRLGTVVAGFDAAARSKLRKAVGKKIKSVMVEVGAALVAGAPVELRDEVTGEVISPVFRPETAQKLFDEMQGSAEYLFNASHSFAYAQLAYVTAFLKANWPAEYSAAILAVGASDEKRSSALRALREENISVFAPDVNRSRAVTFPDGEGGVLIGLSEIKGVGAAGAAVAAEREKNGPFRSPTHMLRRVVDEFGKSLVDVGALEGLIEAGAMDSFGPRRALMRVARALKAHEIVVPADDWGTLERSIRQRRRLGVVMGVHPMEELWEDAVRSVDPIAATGAMEARLPVRKLSMIPSKDRESTTTIAVLADWIERAYSKGTMASFTLESEDTVVRGVTWDHSLTAMRNSGTVPTVGSIVLVEGQVTINERDIEDSEGNVETELTREIMASKMRVIDVTSAVAPVVEVPVIVSPLRAALAAAAAAVAPAVVSAPVELDFGDEPLPVEPTVADVAPVEVPVASPVEVSGEGVVDLPVVVLWGKSAYPYARSTHPLGTELVRVATGAGAKMTLVPSRRKASDEGTFVMMVADRPFGLLVSVPKQFRDARSPETFSMVLGSVPTWQQVLGVDGVTAPAAPEPVVAVEPPVVAPAAVEPVVEPEALAEPVSEPVEPVAPVSEPVVAVEPVLPEPTVAPEPVAVVAADVVDEFFPEPAAFDFGDDLAFE